MIQPIVEIIKELKLSGFQLTKKYHISYQLTLTESLLDNLHKIKDSKFIDFNSTEWRNENQIGKNIDIDFVIDSGCPLIIYSNLNEFYTSKNSITNDLSLINEFYIFDEDVYFQDRLGNNIVLEKINKTMSFSKFISKLMGRQNSENILNKKVFIKDKEININFSYDSYLHIENIDMKFIFDMEKAYSDAYRIEKETILKNSIYHYIRHNTNIDEIIDKWENIFKLYTNKLVELIDYYSLEEKELKISTAKLDSIKLCNEILSDMIVKSLSIPAMIVGVIAINENLENKLSLAITFAAVIFSICTTWISIQGQENLAKKILCNYNSLFKNETFSKEVNKKFQDGEKDIADNISKLENIITLIKSGLITTVIIMVFLLCISYIQ
ncbi:MULTISPECIES: hypothetical protein [Actinobacillus]|uniref:hypothetical protein n=1 Tax=Actinobacillus TaxID=713 RepID=UPI0024182413|nr:MULTISPECIES: hypothetical protein [Actinobacillus]MDG4953455.1 hypothetical protein [Actinobacillus equuli subsp. equuli]WGE33405.1 hypothetical protein NYR61_07855 [Actinobacillus genomosp. 1]WGE48574.1 hypothetical protein NYR67_09965 [Actinobacillus equuli subsp. equuli]